MLWRGMLAAELRSGMWKRGLLCDARWPLRLQRFNRPPDGRRIAYGKGKDVEIKDLASRSPQAVHLEGLTAGVEALAWSPDGGLLAAQTNQKNKKDKTFCIWDTHTGHLRQRIDPPKAGNANGHLAWSPDGTMLARGNLVSGEIWDVATAKLLHSFPYPAKSVAWSPDGRTVAFGLFSEPGGVKLHDAKSGNLLWQYVPQGPLGPAVAFSPDGQTVAAGGKSATILLLDAKLGPHLRQPGWTCLFVEWDYCLFAGLPANGLQPTL